jgi:hypothetical protein
LPNFCFSDHDSTAKKDLDVAVKKNPDFVKESDHYVANSKNLGPSMEEIIRVQQLLKQDPPVDNVIKNLTAIFVRGLKSE